MNRPVKQAIARENTLVRRIEKAAKEHQLLKPSERLLVAVSAGVDSMVLLDVLRRLSKAFDWQLHVAHFNHRLRGWSSDADEKLVRRIAASLNIPVWVESADVRKFAWTQKISIEMAARQLRHEFFARVAREHEIQTLAVAHHADDQVELFFVRLLRGAGPEGLAGMDWSGQSPADPKLRLVRPLLDCAKQELLEYARSGKLKFREDRTNQSLDILRNRIRHELLPLLQKRYQPALRKTTLRLMDILRAESEFLDGLVTLQKMEPDQTTKRPLPPHPSPLPWGEGKDPPAFSRFPTALQRRLMHRQLIELGVQPNFELIEELRHSADTPVMIGPDRVLTRDAAGKITLEPLSGQSFDDQSVIVRFSQESGAVAFGGVEIDWRLDLVAAPFKLPKSASGTESFDAAKVGPSIELRHWRPGDRFQPIGMSKAVKLQDLFVNQKISRPERHKLLVAASSAGDIVWVEGLRISERFKLDSHSQRQLKWRWHRP